MNIVILECARIKVDYHTTVITIYGGKWWVWRKGKQIQNSEAYPITKTFESSFLHFFVLLPVIMSRLDRGLYL